MQGRPERSARHTSPWARVVSSVGGIGYVPVAPGTVGSLAGLAAGGLLLARSPATLLACVVIVAILGVAAIAGAGGAEDPGWVVIDEVAGQMLTLCALATPSPLGLLIGFVAFRAFDIAKPWPVSWADRQRGAVWVMADDILAGMLAALVLGGLAWALPGLGIEGNW